MIFRNRIVTLLAIFVGFFTASGLWAQVGPEQSIKKLYKKAYKQGYQDGFKEATSASEEEFEKLKEKYEVALNEQAFELAKEYKKDTQKTEKLKELIAEVKRLRKTEKELEVTSDSLEELDALLDKSADELVKDALVKLKNYSDDEVKVYLEKKIKDAEFGEIFLTTERNLDFAVAMVKHPDALPKLAQIMDPESFVYLGCNFVVIIIGFIFSLTYLRKREGTPGFRKLRFRTHVVFGFIYVSLFIYFFGDNLGPTLKVFFKVYVFGQ